MNKKFIKYKNLRQYYMAYTPEAVAEVVLKLINENKLDITVEDAECDNITSDTPEDKDLMELVSDVLQQNGFLIMTMKRTIIIILLHQLSVATVCFKR